MEEKAERVKGDRRSWREGRRREQEGFGRNGRREESATREEGSGLSVEELRSKGMH